MGLVCSIVAGVLCVQAPIGGITTMSIEDGGIWISSSVVFVSKFTPAKTWKISTGRSMEFAAPRVETAKLERACAGSKCQSYWRTCDDAAKPTKCTFVIDEGAGVARTIAVEAPDTEQLKHAFDNAGTLVGGAPIAFTAMDHEAPAKQAPLLPQQQPHPF